MCPISGNLKTFEVDGPALMILRMIIELGLNRLKEKVAKFKTESNRVGSEIGFNENGQYCSDDYRTVYCLETNLKKRPLEQRFQVGFGAVFLVKLLLQTTFFGSKINVNCSSTKADIILTGSTILTHVLSFACNSHEIEYLVNPGNIEARYMKTIGVGVFGVCSLFNHSCDPSVKRIAYGKKMVIYANRPIQKDEEITDSYKFLFATTSVKERKEQLYAKYSFECACKACIHLWPQYHAMKEATFVVCPFCKIDVDFSKHQCQDRKVRRIFKDIKQKLFKFQMTFAANTESGKILPETKSVVLDVISALGKMIVLPNFVFFQCQEVLKLCLYLEANKNDIDNI